MMYMRLLFLDPRERKTGKIKQNGSHDQKRKTKEAAKGSEEDECTAKEEMEVGEVEGGK